MDMKNRYGMNIPEDQIDQSIEEAKNKKRMFAFPEKETIISLKGIPNLYP
jgi:hypothetical protein